MIALSVQAATQVALKKKILYLHPGGEWDVQMLLILHTEDDLSVIVCNGNDAQLYLHVNTEMEFLKNLQ